MSDDLTRMQDIIRQSLEQSSVAPQSLSEEKAQKVKGQVTPNIPSRTLEGLVLGGSDGRGSFSASEEEKDAAYASEQDLFNKGYSPSQIQDIMLSRTTAKASNARDDIYERTFGEKLDDTAITFGDAAVQGLLGLGQAATQLTGLDYATEKLTGASIGKSLAELSDKHSKYSDKMRSSGFHRNRDLYNKAGEMAQRDNAAKYADNIFMRELANFGDSALRIATDPSQIVDSTANAAGSLVGFGVGGKALSAIPKLRNMSMTAKTLTTVGMMEGGSAYNDTMNHVQQLDHRTLMEGSKDYRELIAEGKSPSEAKDIVASDAALMAGLQSGTLGVATGGIAGRFNTSMVSNIKEEAFRRVSKEIKDEYKELVKAGAGKEADLFLFSKLPEKELNDLMSYFGTKHTLAGSLAKEGIEETVQESGSQFLQNTAVKQFANDKQDIGEGVGEAGAQGLIGGVGLAGMGHSKSIAAAPLGLAASAIGTVGGVVGSVAVKGADAVSNLTSKQSKELAKEPTIKGSNTKEALAKINAVREVSHEVVENEEQDIAAITKELNARAENFDIEDKDVMNKEWALRTVYAKQKVENLNIPTLHSQGVGSQIVRAMYEEQGVPLPKIAGDLNADMLQLASNPNVHILARMASMAILAEVHAETAQLVDDVLDIQQDIDPKSPLNEVLDKLAIAAKALDPSLIESTRSEVLGVVTKALNKGIEEKSNLDQISLDQLNFAIDNFEHIDLDEIQTFIEHADKQIAEGNIEGITQEQIEAYRGAKANLAKMVKFQNEMSAKFPDSKYSKVSEAIKLDGSEVRPSIMDHYKGVEKALQNGDMNKAGELLFDMGLYAQHMTNKVNALNKSFQAKGKPQTYKSLSNKGKARQWSTSKKELTLNADSIGSVKFAKTVRDEANALVYAHNAIAYSHPELGLQQLPYAELDSNIPLGRPDNASKEAMSYQDYINQQQSSPAVAEPQTQVKEEVSTPKQKEVVKENIPNQKNMDSNKLAEMLNAAIEQESKQTEEQPAKETKVEPTKPTEEVKENKSKPEVKEVKEASPKVETKVDKSTDEGLDVQEVLKHIRKAESEVTDDEKVKPSKTVELSPELAELLNGEAATTVTHTEKQLEKLIEESAEEQLKDETVPVEEIPDESEMNTDLVSESTIELINSIPEGRTTDRLNGLSNMVKVVKKENEGSKGKALSLKNDRTIKDSKGNYLPTEVSGNFVAMYDPTLSSEPYGSFTKDGNEYYFVNLGKLWEITSDPSSKAEELFSEDVIKGLNSIGLTPENLLNAFKDKLGTVSIYSIGAFGLEFARNQSLNNNSDKLADLTIKSNVASLMDSLSKYRMNRFKKEMKANASFGTRFPNLTKNKEGKSYFESNFHPASNPVSRLVGLDSPIKTMMENLTKFMSKKGVNKLTKGSLKGYSNLLGEVADVYAKELDRLFQKRLNEKFVNSVNFTLKDALDNPSLSTVGAVSANLNPLFALAESDGNGGYRINQALFESALLAGFQWYAEGESQTSMSRPQALNYMKEIRDAFGIENFTPEQIGWFFDPAFSKATVVEGLAEKINRYWGAKVNPDASIMDSQAISFAMASEILNLFATVKVGDSPLVTIYNQEFVAPKLNGKRILQKIHRNNVKNNPLTKGIESYRGLIDNAVLREKEYAIYGPNDVIPVDKTQSKLKHVKLTKVQRAVLANEQNTVFKLNQRNYDLFKQLSKKFLVGILDKGFDPSNEKNDVLYNREDLEGRKSRELVVTGALEKVDELKATAEANDWDGVKFKYFVASEGRMHMGMAYGPQDNKVTREIFLPTNDVLDLSDQNGEHFEGYTRALAQGLGIKVNNMSYKKIQENLDHILTSMNGTVEALAKWHLDGRKALPKGFEATFNKEAEAAGFTPEFVSLHALSDYARFTVTEDRSNYETSLYLEADGISSGTVQAMLLLALGYGSIRKLLAKGGIYLNEKMDHGTYYESDNVDLYKVTGDAITNSERISLSADDFSDDNLFGNAFAVVTTTLLDGYSINEEGNLSVTRGPVKGIQTPGLYGSGKKSMGINIVSDIYEATQRRYSAVLMDRATRGSKYTKEAAVARDAQAFLGDFNLEPAEAVKKADKIIRALNIIANANVMYDKNLDEYFILIEREKPVTRFVSYAAPRNALINHSKSSYVVDRLGNAIGHTFLGNIHANMSASVGKNVFDMFDNVVKVSSMTSSIMSIYVKSRMLEKIKEGGKGYKLTYNDINEINAELREMFPDSYGEMATLSTITPEKLHSFGEDYKANNIGRSLNGTFGTTPYINSYGSPGVKAIPNYTIMAGDATSMYVDSLIDPNTGRVNWIFDGKNGVPSQFKESALKINEAFITAQSHNPILPLVLSVIKGSENVFAALPRFTNFELRQYLAKALNEKLKNIPTKKADINLLLESVIETIREHNELMLTDAVISTALSKNLPKIEVSVDTYASAGVPFHQKGLDPFSQEFIDLVVNDIKTLADEHDVDVNTAITKFMEYHVMPDTEGNTEVEQMYTKEPNPMAGVPLLEVPLADGFVQEVSMPNVVKSETVKKAEEVIESVKTKEEVDGQTKYFENYKPKEFNDDSFHRLSKIVSFDAKTQAPLRAKAVRDLIAEVKAEGSVYSKKKEYSENDNIKAARDNVLEVVLNELELYATHLEYFGSMAGNNRYISHLHDSLFTEQGWKDALKQAYDRVNGSTKDFIAYDASPKNLDDIKTKLGDPSNPNWKVVEEILNNNSDADNIVIGDISQAIYSEPRLSSAVKSRKTPVGMIKGNYNSQTKTVYINSKASSAAMVTTLAHELVHSELAKSIADYYTNPSALQKNNASLHKVMKYSTAELERAIKYIEKDFDKNPDKLPKQLIAIIKPFKQGNKVTAVNELLAYGLTEPAVIDYFKEFKLGTRKSSLTSFIKSMAKAVMDRLGFKDLPKTLYEELQFHNALIREVRNSTPPPKGKDSTKKVTKESPKVETKSNPVQGSLFLDSVDFGGSVKGDKQSRLNQDQELANLMDKLMGDVVGSAELKKINEAVGSKPELASTARLTVDTLINAEVSGFSFTHQQAAAFKLIVTLLDAQKNIDPSALRYAHELHEVVMDKLTWSDFKTNDDATDTLDNAFAQSKYNFLLGRDAIANDETGISNIVPAFIALVAVNPQVQEIVSNVEVPKQTYNFDSFDNAVKSVVDYSMIKLDNLARSKSGKDTNVAEAMRTVLNNLAEIQQSSQSKVEFVDNYIGSNIELANNAIVKAKDKAVDKLWKYGNNLQTKVRSNFGKNTIALGQYAVGILSEEKSKAIAKVALEAVNSKRVPILIRDTIADFIGATKENRDVIKLTKVVKAAVQSQRQEFRIEVPKIIESKFSRELEKQEWENITNSLMKLDLANTMQGSSFKSFYTKLGTDAALDNTIQSLMDDIRAEDPDGYDFYMSKINQLANHLVDGSIGSNLLRNANLIANRIGDPNKEENHTPSDKLVKNIDRLTSFIAFRNSSTESKNTFRSLLENEAEGMFFTMSYIKGQYETERTRDQKDLVGRFNAPKGYVPFLTKEGSNLIVQDDSKHDELIRLGYKRVGDYEGSRFEPNKANKGYYYLSVNAQARFNQGIMLNVRESQNGIDATTGHSINPTAGVITDPKIVIAIKNRMSKFDDTATEGLLPIYNVDGSIAAYERVMAKDKLALLDQSHKTSDLIGAWRGRQQEEIDSKEYNKLTIDTLNKMRDDEIERDPRASDQYVNIFSPEFAKENRVAADAIKLIPPDIVKYMKDSQLGAFYVRRDMLNDAFGYRAPSIGDFWTGNSNWSPKTQAAVRVALETILGDGTFRKLVKLQNFTEEVVKVAKTNIIVRSLIVPAINIVSNMVQGAARGITPVAMAKGYVKYSKEIKYYTKARTHLIELEAELRAVGSDSAKKSAIEARIQVVNDSINRLTIKPLIDAGEFSSVSEALTDQSINEIAGGKLEALLERVSGRLPSGLKTVSKNLFLTKDTELFQTLQAVVDYSDFIAKAVLLEKLTKVDKMDQKEAIYLVSEEYINYDRLAGRNRNLLENVGMGWFLNWKIRTTKIALSMLRNNPLHVLMASLIPMPDMFRTVGLPVEDNIISKLLQGKLMYSFGPGMGMRSFSMTPAGMLIL